MGSNKCLAAILTVAALCSCGIYSMAIQEVPTTQSTLLDQSKVKLGIYIESLCSDSRRFFLHQFQPAYKLIGEIIEPHIIPFGKARVLGEGRMVCQHGSRECEGNRRMACVLARGRNQSDAIETIGCLFGQQNSPKDCITKYLPGASHDDIQNCTTSNESYVMMSEAEKQTGRLDYVPHLTFNGDSSEDIQRELESNLRDFVCNLYNGTKPHGCMADLI